MPGNPALNAMRVAVVLCVVMLATGVRAQSSPPTIYDPEYGQPGKDVIWVPTPQIAVETMIDLVKVTADDYVIDLGSGDGRLVIAAAKRGARALGLEYDANLVRYSQREAMKQGVADNAKFVQADIFASDFSQATVLTLFLLPEMNLRLRPQFLKMKPGTRIVANYFGIGDWSSDEVVHIPKSAKCETYCTAHLWIVPANVEGTWRIVQEAQEAQGELTLMQRYQYVEGTLGAVPSKPVTQGRVRGETLNFTVDGVSYRGRISGDIIEGFVGDGDAAARWTAKRVMR
jgi:SAM-dependent methyltransferase